MNWSKIWTSIFGTTTWLGIDIGFWVSMGISLLIAILMIIVFRSLKPLSKKEKKEHKTDLKK